MKARYIIVVAIASVLIAALLVRFSFMDESTAEGSPLPVYLGVDAAYDNPKEIKTLIDAVSPYTNFFIIGSTGITHNETKLNDLCQYIYDKGLSFIIYTEMPPQIESAWIEDAKAKWGNRFLGLYIHDEVGGKQLDRFEPARAVREADNYTDARNQFIEMVNYSINWIIWNFTSVENLQVYTSDYGLYWFDYKAGYDVVFAEFGWNYSRQINVALNRGAAMAQNKDWGVVVTWTYTEPPYIETGEKLYDDIVLAYNNGAKYILIFDTNKDYTHGILGEEHLQALKQFTEYAHKNPRTIQPISERIAYVLPRDFAFGFRGPTDKIWGLWEGDAFAYEQTVKLGNLLKQYGDKLDVIYDDEIEYSTLEYRNVIFWNGTSIGG